MATEHVKVYEEKKGIPVWAWLIPLLLLLALLAWFMLRPKQAALKLPVAPKAAVASTALNGAVPAGPVAISAAALARERETRTTSAVTEPTPSEAAVDAHALDTLSRDLASRWLVGAA